VVVARFVRALREHDKTWDDVMAADPVLFTLALLSTPGNYFFDVDGQGVVWFTDVVPGFSARFHVIAWSRELAGQDEILRRLCIFMADRLDLGRVYTIVPGWLPHVKRAAQRTTWLTHEGTLRNVFRKDDAWQDGELYSVIREELL